MFYYCGCRNQRTEPLSNSFSGDAVCMHVVSVEMSAFKITSVIIPNMVYTVVAMQEDYVLEM